MGCLCAAFTIYDIQGRKGCTERTQVEGKGEEEGDSVLHVSSQRFCGRKDMNSEGYHFQEEHMNWLSHSMSENISVQRSYWSFLGKVVRERHVVGEGVMSYRIRLERTYEIHGNLQSNYRKSAYGWSLSWWDNKSGNEILPLLCLCLNHRSSFIN